MFETQRSIFAVDEPLLLRPGDDVFRVVLDAVEHMECTEVFDIEGSDGVRRGYRLRSLDGIGDTCWNRSFDENYFLDRSGAERMAESWQGEKITGKHIREHAARFEHLSKRDLAAWIVELDDGRFVYKSWYTYRFIDTKPDFKTFDGFIREHTRETWWNGGVRTFRNLLESGEVVRLGEFPVVEDLYLCDGGRYASRHYAYNNGAPTGKRLWEKVDK